MGIYWPDYFQEQVIQKMIEVTLTLTTFFTYCQRMNSDHIKVR